MAENPLELSKIGEIYDRIAFAGVGKFSEFDRLRKHRACSTPTWRAIASAARTCAARPWPTLYSQVIGDEFTARDEAPRGRDRGGRGGGPQLAGHEKNAIYKVQFDGSIMRSQGLLRDRRQTSRTSEGDTWSALPRRTAPRGCPRLGRDGPAARQERILRTLESEKPRGLPPRAQRADRKFRRLSADELRGILGLSAPTRIPPGGKAACRSESSESRPSTGSSSRPKGGRRSRSRRRSASSSRS